MPSSVGGPVYIMSPLSGRIIFPPMCPTYQPFGRLEQPKTSSTNVRRRNVKSTSPLSKGPASTSNSKSRSDVGGRDVADSRQTAHGSQSKRVALSTSSLRRRQLSRSPSSVKKKSTPAPSPSPLPQSSMLSWGDEEDGSDQMAYQQRRQKVRDDSQRLANNLISTRVVYRVQLVNSFVDLYLGWDKIARYQHSDLANLPGIDISTPLLQSVADTICFVGLGAAHQDHRLIVESRIRYGCALRLLADELKRTRPNKKSFHQVVTSIMLLRLCELFDALSFTDGIGGQLTVMDNKGWSNHLGAVQHYMRACGPEGLLETEADWRLFQTVRHTTFYQDLYNESSSIFAEPEWLAMVAERGRTDPAVALYSLRAQFPGLLARARTVCARWAVLGDVSHASDFNLVSTLVGDSDQLHLDLQALRDALGDWMAQSGEMHEAGLSPLAMGAVAEANPEDPTTVPKPSRWHLLRNSFNYSSPEKAGLCTTCWMLCVSLDEAISNLLTARIAAIGDQPTATTDPTSCPHAILLCLRQIATDLASSSSASPVTLTEDVDGPATTTLSASSSSSSIVPTTTFSSPNAALLSLRKAVDHDAYVCATNLARSVDWCCQTNVARVPTVAAFHLRFTRDYFARVGHTRWESWCVAMSRVLEVRAAEGLLVDTMAPKICRRIVSQQFLSLSKGH